MGEFIVYGFVFKSVHIQKSGFVFGFFGVWFGFLGLFLKRINSQSSYRD